MKKHALLIACAFGFLGAAGILLSASSLQVPSGAWITVGPMNSARAGASTVLLQDGRILITGGGDANGPLSTVEFFGANGSFSLATPMNVPRSGHVSVVLRDGRVLVAGGTTSGGTATNSAEIYDPALSSWTSLTGGMVEARSGATAAVLLDGRVIVAGGQNGTLVSSTIEIFDPSLVTFAAAGMMSSPRTRHAMAVLTDGRVLIVGGNNGAATVGSTDIFDPVAGTVSAGPSLSVARYGHSVTTLLNGQVVVIGGNNGSANPAQIDATPTEMFNPVTGTFIALGANLATPREGHLAFLLPNNNNVLIVGGTSGGAAIASAELFTPQESSQGVWTYGFASTGSMTAARNSTTGAPNQVSAPSSVAQMNGVLLIAGGNDGNGNPLNSSEAYGFPTVQTDQGDYPPGTNVTITGSGWQPGETVTLTLVESPLIDTHGPYTVTADANGNISDTSFVTDLHDVGVRFTLTAAGSITQAKTTFTDAPGKVGAVSVAAQVGTLTFGTAGSATYTVTVSRGGGGVFTADLCVKTSLPTGASASFSPASLSFSAADSSKSSTLTISTTAVTPAGTPSFTVRAFNSSGGGTCTSAGGDFAEGSGTLSIAKATPTITWANPAAITYGTALSATQLNATASVPGSFVYTPVSGVILNSGNGQTLHVAFTPTDTTNYNSTSKDVTINVNAKTLTASIINNPTKPYDGNTNATLTAANFSLTGLLGTDSFTVTKATGTYNSKDVATASTVTTSLATGDFTPVGGTLAANYTLPTTASGASHITPAHLTVKGDDKSKTYDGAVFSPFTVTITGFVNSETVAVVSGSAAYSANATSAVNAGSYTITPSVGTLSAANYDFTTFNTGTLTINKADAMVVVTPYTVTYDGHAHTAIYTTITGVNGETGATVGTVTLNTTHTSAGTYASDSWSFTGAANYNNIASTTITDTINKADATVVVTPYTVTYDGQPHTATYTITGVNGETGATVGTVTLNTTHTSAGTYASDSWSFTGAANYNNIASTTITDTINKADATFTVSPYTVTYDGHAHTATYTTITGVNGETGATVGTVTLNTTHTSAGTYASDSWSFTGAANYNNIASTTITDTINKADATVMVTPYTVTYDGQPHTATYTITGVNGETGATVGTVTLNTTHTSAGTYASDSWSFTGAANYNNIASTTITDTINKADATVMVTPYTVTYDGQPHTATYTITGVNGETGATVGTVTLNTTHTSAGTYASDSWSFTGAANYNNIASTTITDTINKANATVVVTPYTVIYDGQPHTATYTITGVNGETGATVGTVTLSTTHTAAGTYASDSWSFTGAANYNNIASTTITDTINKANATVVVTPYTVIYDGQPHTATYTITGVNGETGATVGTVTLNTTHTSAGTYASDSWSFTGAANYNNIASTTITDTINKADATFTVSPYTVTYDGHAHTAIYTTITGVNGETGATVGTVTLNTTHTSAGTYASDSWSFTGAANYNNIASTTITDTINKANATVVVTPYTVIYDGQPHTATYTITGVNGETGATVGTVTLNTTHTSAGTYASDSWSFTGVANYNNIASTTITDTINKADATVMVTPYTVTYDGQPHTATYTITGVNGETGATVGTVTLNTTHTSAGTYASDSWSFTGAANYNNIASTTITDTINKADATVMVTPYTVTYDGQPHTATYTITGVNGETGATVGTVTLNTTHTSAGTYASDSWSFTGAANYNNIASTTITDTINKADATFTVSPYTVTYDGHAHTATYTTITGVNGETGATVGTVTLNTTHTSAGTYASDSWSFTGVANYNNIASTTITNTINKANAVIAVTPYNVTYDGNAHTATGTAKGVESPAPVDLTSLLHVTGTTHTNAGDYSIDGWTFDGNSNYNSTSGTVHDVINKALLTVTADNKTMILHGALPTFTPSYTGFKLTDTFATAVTGSPSLTATATSASSVGPYTITAALGTLAANNYTFTFVNGTLTIQYVSGGICDGDAGHQILQPINNDGSSVWKQGSTVPAKFRVCDVNGVSIGTPGVVQNFVLYKTNQGTLANVDELTLDNSTNDLGWRFDSTAQQWIFNMSTKLAPINQTNTTYYFQISLNDGTNIFFIYGLK